MCATSISAGEWILLARTHVPALVQIRMMPKCWFILMRFWLRVDDTLIRLHEARYFCSSDKPREVLREVKQYDSTFATLQEAGAPSNNVRSPL
jgi:type 2A phosphatase activator TIP41